uniref:DNA/RNA-binding protein Alba-like domain-containing protein n=1 Tax=Kalanchoe fedtschenkoi TaxID=63787 RepID=A0A7N0UUE3_KALFE
MERYRRVEKRKPQQSLKDNEIRITALGFVRNYISYALSLLQDHKTKEIVLKAMGQAISKAVGIAEIIKKRTPGLHQDIVISSTSITDVWEPVEEGLIPLEISRQVSLISITLSTTELNKTSPGYQSPSRKDHLKSQNQYEEQNRTSKHGTNEDVYVQGQGRHGKGREIKWGRHLSYKGCTSAIFRFSYLSAANVLYREPIMHGADGYLNRGGNGWTRNGGFIVDQEG